MRMCERLEFEPWCQLRSWSLHCREDFESLQMKMILPKNKKWEEDANKDEITPRNIRAPL